jgi:hypothetical protein
MPNLLTVRLRPDEHEVLFPWEQHSRMRADLDLHAASCGSCTITALSLFDVPSQRDNVEVRCEEGIALATALVRAKNEWRAWRG